MTKKIVNRIAVCGEYIFHSDKCIAFVFETSLGVPTPVSFSLSLLLRWNHFSTMIYVELSLSHTPAHSIWCAFDTLWIWHIFASSWWNRNMMIIMNYRSTWFHWERVGELERINQVSGIPNAVSVCTGHPAAAGSSRAHRRNTNSNQMMKRHTQYTANRECITAPIRLLFAMQKWCV